MPLDMPNGTACFVDANIFYYHIVEMPGLSQPSTAFLERVASGEVLGFTSVHVLAEAVHKIMLAKAAAAFALNRTGLVNWLQRHRDRITELRQFRQAAGELLAIGMSIVPADGLILQDAARLSAELGVLTNDALVPALIQRHGLLHLATNDDDFDAAPGLKIWKPR